MEYNKIRRKTKKVKVGRIYIGGDAPVSVQSMTNTPSVDFESTAAQVRQLETVGCDVVRIAVPDMDSVRTVAKIKESDIGVPIVADIHFNGIYDISVLSFTF